MANDPEYLPTTPTGLPEIPVLYRQNGQDGQGNIPNGGQHLHHMEELHNEEG